MRMATPVRRLFDYPSADIAALLPEEDDPVWDVFSLRQRTYAVHGTTRSIVFSWLAELQATGPQPVVSSQYAPAGLVEAVTACGARITESLGGTLVRLLLTELRTGQSIPRHSDRGEILERTHRCHVPIVTNEEVRFLIDDEPHHLKTEVAYEIDNMRPHAVENAGTTRRVHLICNVLPAAR